MSAIERCGVPGEAIASLSIGTTVATNALLTRRGANVFYLTTQGFEDIPYIQRMNRKHHFSLKWRKPKPLVERRNCFGVRERLDFHGRVVIPLTDAAIEEVAKKIEERLPEYPDGSVAIAIETPRRAARPVSGYSHFSLARSGADLARVRARQHRHRR
jgi:N-methylhydantoinase A